MKYHITLKSGNNKTGFMPVTTSSRDTCPDACPLKGNGCYAESGPLALHWRKVTNGERGLNWAEFVQSIRSLPRGILWRHNQAGDLPGIGDSVDVPMMFDLIAANKGKRGFTYTHKPMTVGNQTIVQIANTSGFTINLSANSLHHADQLKGLDVGPVVVVVPRDTAKVSFTPAGNKVVVCPAQSSDRVTCASCGLCAVAKRDYVIGFRAHGSQAKKAEQVVA